jgi:AAT family amino acid transporter
MSHDAPAYEAGKPPYDGVHSDVEGHAHVGHIQSDRLKRSLSARQVQMIAIGGTIGTGLFLGTGKSLATGGPASILIAYAIVGGIVFTTMLSLGEMAAFIPVAGSFCTFAGWAIPTSMNHGATADFAFSLDALLTMPLVLL